MASAKEQYRQALASLTGATRSRAEAVARRLVREGGVRGGRAAQVAEDLARRVRKNREAAARLLQREVKRQLAALGIATRDDVARLQERVRALEQAAEQPQARTRPGGRAGAREGTGTRTRKGTGARAAGGRARGAGTAGTEGGQAPPAG